MKTFYVLHDGSHYLYNDPILMEAHGVATYTEYIGEAMQFESLCQALDFKQLHELEISVLKVEITVAYTPDLFTEKSNNVSH